MEDMGCGLVSVVKECQRLVFEDGGEASKRKRRTFKEMLILERWLMYLRQMRKMVMQEARMTRQSTATITDIRWRCGSPTEVDS